MARLTALAAAIAVSLLAVSGAGGAATQQTPKRGGTLTFGQISDEPACLNVLDARCSPTGALLFIAPLILGRPFEIGPDLTYRPRLVSSVAFTRTRPFTLTYRIRPDARWSDGAPVTAQDFVFTLRAIRRHGSDYDRAVHAVVRSARALGTKTLRVVLRPRTAAWRDLFGFVLPSHVLRGQDLTTVWRESIDDPRTGQAIGSGPFLVESLERGRGLVLRRNPRYWGARPYLDRLVIRFRPAATDPRDALTSGELDIATGVLLGAVPAVRQAGLRVLATTGITFERLNLQLGQRGHPALRSKLVRRALAYGIDRVALVRQLFGAIDREKRPLDSALLVSRSRHYEANWRAYRYRPALARRLLEQAGCRRGADGIYSCRGERLALRFVTFTSPAREQALALVQSQLRQVGVEVRPTFAPFGTLIGQILPAGDYDVALLGWAATPGESWLPVFGCGGTVNYGGYCQRLVTSDLDQADRILDDSQRARALNRVDRQLAKDVPTIPLWEGVSTAAHIPAVRNFTLLPLNLYWNAERWWLDR